MDAWIHRLKEAHDAGYYKTEPAECAQTAFPWQNKTCQDCPFWSDGVCRVYGVYRPGEAHTCAYFDPWNRAAGEVVVRQRQWQSASRWWEWFNDRGAAR